MQRTRSTVPSPSTVRTLSTSNYQTSNSSYSLTGLPRDTSKKEIVTFMFETMLNNIVISWDTREVKEIPDVTMANENKVMSDITLTGDKKKPTRQKSRMRKSTSISRYDIHMDSTVDEPVQQARWSCPDEIAIIHFRNGNIYEGNISMKCMHGEGRFQWSNGTVYVGEFCNNDIKGKGRICWKDDTWYEGDFVGNVRHGKGLYVNSRKQSSYSGGWDNGTKHGKGTIYYDGTLKNNFNGDWVHNVRHGYGAREYCAISGYAGEWDRYVREGKGAMIWPNHDFYEGGWTKGLMSGYGTYIWNAECNNTLSLPAINVYRGDFKMGKRSGNGALNFGLDWGAHYKGTFKNDRKHGMGKIVTNSGLIIQDFKLFRDDIMRTTCEKPSQSERMVHDDKATEPLKFDICDASAGMMYHIEQAYQNLDREAEIKTTIINTFIENNKYVGIDLSLKVMNLKETIFIDSLYDRQTFAFEETALLNAVKSHQTNLNRIYYKYSVICNDEPATFTPRLIRLFLWQFYWDCNIHEKGLTLVEIDNIFHSNPEWLSKSPHNPFQKIFFWQFLHSIIAVASKLYASKVLPGPKPDTLVATAFRKFMDEDVLPGYGRRCGRFCNGFGSYIPLKSLYSVYVALGEPHTVRKFICSIRRLPLDIDHSAKLFDGPEDIILGHNFYIFGDQMIFVKDDIPLLKNSTTNEDESQLNGKDDLILFNFSNLSTWNVIKIFAKIFPQMLHEGKILTLDIEMTFLEFFEAFVACAEQSVRIKEKEMLWREIFDINNKGSLDYNGPPMPPPSHYSNRINSLK